MTLPKPIKSVLDTGPYDAHVARGWPRVQRKRRVRDTARKSVLAVCCLALAGAVGWAVRPYYPAHPAAPAVAAVAPKVPGKLDVLVQQLPKAQGRAPGLQRPAEPAPAPVPVEEQPAEQVDVVGALLESVRDAYEHGDTARAAALLSEIAEKHEDDRRAAQALYVLGLIQLDRNKDAKGAADSFTHALELQPPPDLVPVLWQSLQRARASLPK